MDDLTRKFVEWNDTFEVHSNRHTGIIKRLSAAMMQWSLIYQKYHAFPADEIETIKKVHLETVNLFEELSEVYFDLGGDNEKFAEILNLLKEEIEKNHA